MCRTRAAYAPACHPGGHPTCDRYGSARTAYTRRQPFHSQLNTGNDRAPPTYGSIFPQESGIVSSTTQGMTQIESDVERAIPVIDGQDEKNLGLEIEQLEIGYGKNVPRKRAMPVEMQATEVLAPPFQLGEFQDPNVLRALEAFNAAMVRVRAGECCSRGTAKRAARALVWSWGASQVAQAGSPVRDRRGVKALKVELKGLKRALKHDIKAVWRVAP